MEGEWGRGAKYPKDGHFFFIIFAVLLRFPNKIPTYADEFTDFTTFLTLKLGEKKGGRDARYHSDLAGTQK